MNKMEVFSKRLKATVKLGVFSLKRFFNEAVGASDQITSKTLGKGEADTVGASDVFSRVVAYIRSFADSADISDQKSIGALKPFSDSGSASDGRTTQAGLNKQNIADSADTGRLLNQDYTSEFYFGDNYVGIRRIFSAAKPILDFYISSDLASIRPLKPFADSGSIVDALFNFPQLSKLDTIGSTDFGAVLNQDYSSSFYFADDYVGTKRTF